MAALDMHVSYFKLSLMTDTRKTTAKPEHLALLYTVFFLPIHIIKCDSSKLLKTGDLLLLLKKKLLNKRLLKSF